MVSFGLLCKLLLEGEGRVRGAEKSISGPISPDWPLLVFLSLLLSLRSLRSLLLLRSEEGAGAEDGVSLICEERAG